MSHGEVRSKYIALVGGLGQDLRDYDGLWGETD